VAWRSTSRYTRGGREIGSSDRFAVPITRSSLAAIPLRRVSRTLTLLLVLLAVFLAGILAIRLYMGREAEDRLDEVDVIDFADLAPAAATDRFLMCPEAICNVPAGARSPVFDIEWERLRGYWSEVVAHQSHVKLISGDGELEKITYIQHTTLLRLPEIVTIQFYPVGDHGSSFAIESHSRYGITDLGSNRDRVLAWVALLQRVAKEHRAP
jgi:Protein of unknown function (DUF1499)